MTQGPQQQPWRRVLRDARKKLGLSRTAVAETSGISPSAIRSYESGARHPTRAHLVALLGALQVEQELRDRVLIDAGYAGDPPIFEPDLPGYAFTAEEAAEHVELQPWPCMVLNEFMEVVAANQVAQKLWGIDLERDFPELLERNLLIVASDPRFADRVVNWDEAVTTGVALLKGHHRYPEPLPEATNARFAAVLNRFFQGDSKYIARFLKIWETAPPLAAKIRWAYRIEWDVPGVGIVRFRIMVTSCNPRLVWAFNDWIPEDEESWEMWARVSRELGSGESRNLRPLSPRAFATPPGFPSTGGQAAPPE